MTIIKHAILAVALTILFGCTGNFEATGNYDIKIRKPDIIVLETSVIDELNIQSKLISLLKGSGINIQEIAHAKKLIGINPNTSVFLINYDYDTKGDDSTSITRFTARVYNLDREDFEIVKINFVGDRHVDDVLGLFANELKMRVIP